DPVDLGRPDVQVVDVDKASVEVDEHVLSGAVPVHIGEQQPGQLPPAGSAYRQLSTTEFRIQHLVRVAGDVPVGQGVSPVAVGHQTRDRGEVFPPLHVGDDRIAAADVVEWEPGFPCRRGLGDLLYQSHADRNLLAAW